jgi:hypothetical protein
MSRIGTGRVGNPTSRRTAADPASLRHVLNLSIGSVQVLSPVAIHTLDDLRASALSTRGE